MADQGPSPDTTLFAFFNEVGILAQLSRAVFEARLPEGFSVPQFSVLNHLERVRDGQTPLALAQAYMTRDLLKVSFECEERRERERVEETGRENRFENPKRKRSLSPSSSRRCPRQTLSLS